MVLRYLSYGATLNTATLPDSMMKSIDGTRLWWQLRFESRFTDQMHAVYIKPHILQHLHNK